MPAGGRNGPSAGSVPGAGPAGRCCGSSAGRGLRSSGGRIVPPGVLTLTRMPAHCAPVTPSPPVAATPPRDEGGHEPIDDGRAGRLVTLERRPVLLRPGTDPAHDEPLLGARERHVEHASQFGTLTGLQLLGELGVIEERERLRTRRRAQAQPEPSTVAEERRRGVRPLRAETGDDDRVELEALGLVHRHELHGAAPAKRGLRSPQPVALLAGGAIDEGRHVAARRHLVGGQTAQPREIRQPPRTTLERCEVFVIAGGGDHLVDERRRIIGAAGPALVLEELRERAHATSIVVGEPAVGDGGQERVEPARCRPGLVAAPLPRQVADEREAVGAQRDERRGEHRDEGGVVLRVAHEPQPADQVGHLEASPEALRPIEHRIDAQHGERLGDGHERAAGAREHGHRAIRVGRAQFGDARGDESGLGQHAARLLTRVAAELLALPGVGAVLLRDEHLDARLPTG